MPDIVSVSPIHNSQSETEERPNITESQFRVFKQLRNQVFVFFRVKGGECRSQPGHNQALGATQAQNQSANAGAVSFRASSSGTTLANVSQEACRTLLDAAG